MLSQAKFVREYTDQNRLQFNDQLFEKDGDEIIVELIKVIMSAQRDNEIFSILVDSFTITEDYDKINQILGFNKNRNQKNKKKKETNEYEYVNLKDTDAKLLTVRYLVKARNEARFVDVHILVPRIVNKYYFRIGGNMWFAMFQVVDGSTYNNSTASNPKHQSITFKSSSTPLRIFKNNTIFTDIHGNDFENTYYTVNVFTKTVLVFKYIFAKFGFWNAQQFIGIDCVKYIDHPVDDENMYCVKIRDGIYIYCPKYLYDNNLVVQSLFYSMFYSAYQIKRITMDRLMTNDFWLESLGMEYSSQTVKKGKDILYSLEGAYDITTKQSLNLGDEARNIYSIILWIVREFNNLRTKDNLDVTLKRIRYGEHIASLYSMKLVQSLRMITDKKGKIDIDSIVRSIRTKPTELLDKICKSPLVNYRNLANDMDSLLAMKYTYKGPSGMGNDNSKSIAVVYRHVHPSHLNILDVDSSPKSDPGTSGTLCPTLDLYNGYFSEYEEPVTWEDEYSKTLEEYNKMVHKKEVLIYKKKVGMKLDEDKLTVIEENLKIMEKMIKPLVYEYNDWRLDSFKDVIELGAKIYFN